MARNNIYQTLIGKLEKALSGMAEGTLLPSEQELADRFGVSKPRSAALLRNWRIGS